MSYCVNCGVELAESEKCCPLCHTEVLNPRAPWTEPSTRPYPPRLERIMKRIDRRYLSLILGAFLLLPMLISLLCDLLIGAGIRWSAYVLAAGLLLMVWFLLPLWFKRFYLLRFLSLDGLAALLFLAVLAWIGGGDWFLPLAAPITLCAFAALLLLVYLCRQTWARRWLIRSALVLLMSSVFCILVELIVDLYLSQQVQLSWSLFVLISCLSLALAALILESKQKLKDEILKRMFY